MGYKPSNEDIDKALALVARLRGVVVTADTILADVADKATDFLNGVDSGLRKQRTEDEPVGETAPVSREEKTQYILNNVWEDSIYKNKEFLEGLDRDTFGRLFTLIKGYVEHKAEWQ